MAQALLALLHALVSARQPAPHLHDVRRAPARAKFGVSVQTTALLFLVNGIINVLTLRWTGQLVGKIGERTAMSITFASLALIFLGYAYVNFLPLLFVLFILDNIFFGFNVSLSSYFQKIAVSKEEVTANVSTQQAIEHIAAITVPLIGGTVWAVYGSAGAVPLRRRDRPAGPGARAVHAA